MEFDRIHRNEATSTWPDVHSFWRFDTFEPKVSFWFSRIDFGSNLSNLQNVEQKIIDKLSKRSTWLAFRRENQKNTFGSKVSNLQNEYKSGHLKPASFLCILSNSIVDPIFWLNNYVDNSQIWVTVHTVGRIGVLEQQCFSFLYFHSNPVKFHSNPVMCSPT